MPEFGKNCYLISPVVRHAASCYDSWYNRMPDDDIKITDGKSFGETPVTFALVIALSAVSPLHKIFGEGTSYLGLIAVIITSLFLGLKPAIAAAAGIWTLRIGADAYMEGSVVAQAASNIPGLIFMFLVGVTVAKLRDLNETLSREVAERRSAEETLAAARQYERSIIESSLDMIIAVDHKDKIIEFNKAAQETFGYTAEEILGKPVEVLYVDDAEHRRVHEMTADHGKCVCEIFNRRKNGQVFQSYLTASVLRDRGGNAVGIMGISRDITERKRLEEKLHHDAYYDALTGLPNRAMFIDRLRESMARVQRRGNYRFAVLLLDLDRFKNINDSLGHAAGDELLRVAGERLTHGVRPFDTVARFGSDEFAILLAGMGNARAVTNIVKRVQNRLKLPVKILDHDIYTTTSIGITISKGGQRDPEDILREADTAMYRAKTLGRDRYVIFDETMHEQVSSYMKLENSMRQALENREFLLHYQPILSVENEIVGFESLLRWLSPEGDLVLPGEFIPLAEETGLIMPIGDWALREACRQMHEWHTRYPQHRQIAISVNLSARQFALDLPEKISRTLGETGLAPERLILEITESVIMNNPDIAAEVFRRLREKHIRIQMDDFGTGYSSLGYLRDYPFDAIKIDKSFIGAMCDSQWAMEIVKTIITMAHNMRLEVIAEGVETPEQLEELKNLNCDYYQGFWFSRPLGNEDAEAVLERVAVRP